jgi:hypothetical protein
MTDLRRPPRLRRIRAGLGEQQPDQTETANGDRRETPKRDTATEMIHHVARERGAERGADTYCAPYDAKPQVEPSRAAHDVRDDERENHPENGGADAIEDLHGHDQIGTGYQRKEYPAQRKGRKAEQQQRPASPRVALASDPRRDACDDELRNDDAGPGRHRCRSLLR